MTFSRPETRYARSGDVYIAYQVVCEGPMDLVHTPGAISHLEATWDLPAAVRYMSRLAASFRVVYFDKRGTGMSDRTAGIATLEERMDDIRAVMDAAEVERTVVMGVSEGGPMSALFAATYPERTSALILYGSIVTGTRTEETPWAALPEEWDEYLERLGREWGTAAGLEASLKALAPSRLRDEPFKRWFAEYRRLGASPGAAIALSRMNREIDIRSVLSVIRVPTLVVNRTGDLRHLESSRLLAARIPGRSQSNCRASTTCPSRMTPPPTCSSIRSSNSSPAHGRPPNPTAFSPRCCLPISSAPRSVRRRWVISDGVRFSRLITP